MASVPLFTRSIPLEKALHPDTILAYEMNGRPLPLLHGAPLRVITPGWMADSCTKWLTDITVQAEESAGLLHADGLSCADDDLWNRATAASGQSSPVEAMVVKSLIAAPQDGETVKSGPVTIQGVAWAGEVKIAKVEVSVDEGKTWETARLVGEDHPYAWRQWQLVWKAQDRRHVHNSLPRDRCHGEHATGHESMESQRVSVEWMGSRHHYGGGMTSSRMA